MPRPIDFHINSDLATVENPGEMTLTVNIPAGATISGGNSITYTAQAVAPVGGIPMARISSTRDSSRETYRSLFTRVQGPDSNNYTVNAYVRYSSSNTVQLRVVLGHGWIVFSPTPPASVSTVSETITAKIRIIDAQF